MFYCGKALVWHKMDQNRNNLKYIAKWHINYGRYLARKEPNRKDLTCYFEIPRYLFKETIKNMALSILNLFRKRFFLKHYIYLFINIGQILEYKKLKYAKSKRSHSNL